MTDRANTISDVTVARLPSRGQASFRAQAVLAGSGIDLAALGSTDRTGAAPLAVELIGAFTGGALAANSAAGGGVAFLFRYGAVVFFDAAPAGITEYLRQIGPHIRQPFPQLERETEVLDIRLDPSAKETIEHNTLVLADVSIEKLQLVADIMAKSVSLAHHEKGIERQFERIEPFAVNLDHWGRGGRAARELLHNLGGALLAWTTRRNCSGTIPNWSGSGRVFVTSSRSANGSRPCTGSSVSSRGPRRPRWNCCRTAAPCGWSGRSWG